VFIFIASLVAENLRDVFAHLQSVERRLQASVRDSTALHHVHGRIFCKHEMQHAEESRRNRDTRTRRDATQYADRPRPIFRSSDLEAAWVELVVPREVPEFHRTTHHQRGLLRRNVISGRALSQFN